MGRSLPFSGPAWQEQIKRKLPNLWPAQMSMSRAQKRGKEKEYERLKLWTKPPSCGFLGATIKPSRLSYFSGLSLRSARAQLNIDSMEVGGGVGGNGEREEIEIEDCAISVCDCKHFSFFFFSTILPWIYSWSVAVAWCLLLYQFRGQLIVTRSWDSRESNYR